MMRVSPVRAGGPSFPVRAGGPSSPVRAGGPATALAGNAGIRLQPDVAIRGDHEIRRIGNVWRCSAATARELGALLSHR